ncbi:hypothetical protein PAAG_11523 [Paracoccidioides lutzii Pb01]|uniref:Uncharacterized protein n=1 Tax=Paracoccidioides lutzii (strain ATCC MYA-826 / Pb01) TaxID=502779 RepID=A0A0A2V2J8_PARBA|nr:hypothetical protein PAAG_11523 [Paracoccidioides lutzii Pb01]KGQ01678.1 hypothetical protein PAAG_11523 [Paracoccidioides lutzii Pb01]
MISPCDPAILINNPQFKALHQQLTTTILNPDGSTRAHAADPSRRAVQADLKKYLIRAVKARILRRVVARVAVEESKEGLDDELRNLVSVIVLYIQHTSSFKNSTNNDELHSLFSPDLKRFHSAIPSLIPSISTLLSADLSHLKSLARTISTSTSNSGNHNSNSSDRQPSHQPTNQPRPHNRLRPLSLKPSPADISLPSQLSNRLRTLRTIQSHDLPTARTKMTVTAAAVLAAHAQVMERMIHILERTKHGALARGGKARAEHVAVVLQGIEGKRSTRRKPRLHWRVIAIIWMTRVYGLEERRKQAVLKLEAYERADSGEGAGTDGDGGLEKPGAMVEIARRYGALVKEVDGVRMEIRRLGG